MKRLLRATHGQLVSAGADAHAHAHAHDGPPNSDAQASCWQRITRGPAGEPADALITSET